MTTVQQIVPPHVTVTMPQPMLAEKGPDVTVGKTNEVGAATFLEQGDRPSNCPALLAPFMAELLVVGGLTAIIYLANQIFSQQSNTSS